MSSEGLRRMSSEGLRAGPRPPSAALLNRMQHAALHWKMEGPFVGGRVAHASQHPARPHVRGSSSGLVTRERVMARVIPGSPQSSPPPAPPRASAAHDSQHPATPPPLPPPISLCAPSSRSPSAPSSPLQPAGLGWAALGWEVNPLADRAGLSSSQSCRAAPRPLPELSSRADGSPDRLGDTGAGGGSASRLLSPRAATITSAAHQQRHGHQAVSALQQAHSFPTLWAEKAVAEYRLGEPLSHFPFVNSHAKGRREGVWGRLASPSRESLCERARRRSIDSI